MRLGYTRLACGCRHVHVSWQAQPAFAKHPSKSSPAPPSACRSATRSRRPPGGPGSCCRGTSARCPGTSRTARHRGWPARHPWRWWPCKRGANGWLAAWRAGRGRDWRRRCPGAALGCAHGALDADHTADLGPQVPGACKRGEADLSRRLAGLLGPACPHQSAPLDLTCTRALRRGTPRSPAPRGRPV